MSPKFVKRMLQVGSLMLISKAVQNGEITDDMLLDSNTSILTFAAELGRLDVCKLLLNNFFEPRLTREISRKELKTRSCIDLISHVAMEGILVEQKDVEPCNKGSLLPLLKEQREHEKYNFEDTLPDLDYKELI